MVYDITNKLSSSELKEYHANGHSAVQNTCKETDLKVISIRAKVLETIRNKMPITTLFTPEFKIDLEMFVKDQMFIHKIAEFISPLIDTGSIDAAVIAKHFDNSELLAEIKMMFKQDSNTCLTFFFEACSDVLNKKSVSNRMKPAIEGRIFTLKNGLVAQQTPQAIHKSQVQNKMKPQDLPNIKEEGACFIRESLYIHLNALKGLEKSSFRERLISTAEQLIPFTQNITSIYLKEQGKDCTMNPLTFRNPTGYNQHGSVAATVMESCLNALGYKTQIMGRCDLEPKVTLATMHLVVEVMGPNKERYIIDPCYIQFHKDVCLDDSLLPKSPVLVLAESEVDEYIEKNIMVNWKNICKQVSANNSSVITKLKERDQILTFIIDKIGMLEELIPSDKEEWVRRSFKRIWGLSTYSPVLSNQGFEDIFYGSREKHYTYDCIKSMGIAPLTHHLSFEAVEKRLEDLLRDKTLICQNSFEALSLIAQLPKLKRDKYASLLDLDPRLQANNAVEVSLNAYFRSLKKVVNPTGKDLSVIYGCSGGDCSSILLATDAKDLTFVDLTKTSFSEFKAALAQLKDRDFLSEILTTNQLEQSNYLSFRSRYMGSTSTYRGKGQHHMDELPLKLLFDLREMGVDLKKAVLTSIEDGVRIDFPWKFYGAAESRMRSLIFVTADITKPALYPVSLKRKLKEGIDIFYMKGAYFAPQAYPQFLPDIAKSINPGGWLMTTDKTLSMEITNPEQCLDKNKLSFVQKKSEEMGVLEELMNPPFNPLFPVPTLDYFLPDKRSHRNSGTDLTYWSILSLRQKIERA